MMKILSLGAGVQSSTILRMSIKGELPKLDGAIFADTQWEPSQVYAHLEILETEAKTAGIPIYRVTRGNLRETVLNTKTGHWPRPPFYVKNPDGSRGLAHRQCTGDYKLDVIRKQMRLITGITSHMRPKGPVIEQWIGISLDEAHRMKPAKEIWIESKWPLIDLRMKRGDCLEWNKKNGFSEPPRSACIGCPFHSDHEWRNIKDNPEQWADACDFDQKIRQSERNIGLKGEFYLHGQLVPLSDVDLSTPEDHGQLNMFGNECEGLCGV